MQALAGYAPKLTYQEAQVFPSFRAGFVQLVLVLPLLVFKNIIFLIIIISFCDAFIYRYELE